MLSALKSQIEVFKSEAGGQKMTIDNDKKLNPKRAQGVEITKITIKLIEERSKEKQLTDEVAGQRKINDIWLN